MDDLRIRVAVGVLHNEDGAVLIGQRTVKDAYFNKWEFPGGKIEPGETIEVALQRELNEEIGIKVIQSNSLVEVQHDYPDRSVQLYVHQVAQYEGEPTPREGQLIRWVMLSELDQIDFLKGNQAIVDALR